jgi:hypothetical protein
VAFRISIPDDAGAKVAGPPHKWRPRALTVMEKIEIVVRQNGRDPSGERLNPIDGGVEFDHQPSIQARRWDEEKQDTIPPSCDLAYIVALNKPDHRTKTAKSDVPEIAKTRRLEAGKKKPRTPFPKRTGVNWPKRKFGK